MNTSAYIIYLFITYLVTVHAGLTFYRNGKVYILRLLQDERLTTFINKSLLTGYYLVNLGYAAIVIRTWKTIYTWPQLVASIGTMTGKIMLILAVMHFFNMAVILFFSRRHHSIINNKT